MAFQGDHKFSLYNDTNSASRQRNSFGLYLAKSLVTMILIWHLGR